MRLYEFTDPSDYALLANEINDVLRQLKQIWKGRCPIEGGGSEDRTHQREIMVTEQ
jgi:hypothetical protein